MDKKIKMVLYGEPGVGKSTFASKAPNPLFICSDGNFAWLDLDESHCREVSSWQECKKILNEKSLLEQYETIVLDLTEDLFKWCEQEFCIKNKLEHIGDLGYGKGYQYAHDTEDKLTNMECLPPSLKGKIYYNPNTVGNEIRFKERLEAIKRWKHDHSAKEEK